MRPASFAATAPARRALDLVGALASKRRPPRLEAPAWRSEAARSPVVYGRVLLRFDPFAPPVGALATVAGGGAGAGREAPLDARGPGRRLKGRDGVGRGATRLRAGARRAAGPAPAAPSAPASVDVGDRPSLDDALALVARAGPAAFAGGAVATPIAGDAGVLAALQGVAARAAPEGAVAVPAAVPSGRPGVAPSAAAAGEAGEAGAPAKGVLPVCCFAMFAASLNITVLYVAFQDIGRSFAAASVADLSWVLNAFTIVNSALIVPAGRVADRLGHKRSFLLAVAAFAAGSGLCGVAPSVAVLVAARVVQAVGAALLVPSSLALVLGAFAPERRASALGIWSAVSALAAALGPGVGSAVVQHFGWRWVFLANVPIGLGVWARGRRALAESPRDEGAAMPDPLGAALLVAALSALSLGAIKGNEWGWSGPRAAGAALVGAAAAAAFVARSRRVRAPALDLGLFADRTFSVANVATFVFNAGFTAAFFGNVLFLTKAWGYPLQRAGLAITPGPLAVVPVAIVGGRLADRHGYRSVVVGGGFVAAAGGAWLVHCTGRAPDFLSLWLPGMLLTGAGVGLLLPALSGAATAGLSPDRLGAGGAINQAVRQFGAALGVALVVALLPAAGATLPGPAFARVYALLVGAGLLTSALGVALRRARATGPGAGAGAAGGGAGPLAGDAEAGGGPRRAPPAGAGAATSDGGARKAREGEGAARGGARGGEGAAA